MSDGQVLWYLIIGMAMQLPFWRGKARAVEVIIMIIIWPAIPIVLTITGIHKLIKG